MFNTSCNKDSELSVSVGGLSLKISELKKEIIQGFRIEAHHIWEGHGVNGKGHLYFQKACAIKGLTSIVLLRNQLAGMDQLSLYTKDAFSTAISCPYSILLGTVAFGATVYLMKKYFGGGVCYSKNKLTGKTAIITGSNTGIGLETAIDFAKRGCRVILACRSVEKGQAAVEEVKKRANSEDVVFVQLDLASLQSVREFAAKILEEEARLDLLINNAGVMMCPYTLTDDGFELQFGVNHLAHFLLTNLLLERMKEAPDARIVNVSSLGHSLGKINFDDLKSERSYNSLTAYGQSKLANILFTRQLAKRMEGTSVTAYALHPGGVRTELARHINIVIVSHNGCRTSEISE